MKTRWYRKSGIKGLLVLLTVFFMVAVCAGAGASVLIMSKGVQPLDSKDYVDSQSFTDNVYNLSHTIVDAINERHILDQADDEELIDLKELNRGDTLTHKSTSGLAYRAGDLYDWAKSSSWDTSTNVLICRQPDGSDYYMYYRDFADKIATGELKFVFGSDEDEGTENTKDILSMLSGREYTYYGYESDNIGIRNNGVEYVTDADGNVVYTDVYNYESSGNNDAPLKEVYKPDGADSILDVVNNNKEWKGNLNKAYQYLYEALVQYSDASYGEKILKTYASGATNVNYMYVDTKSGKVYTNIKDVTSSNYLKTLDKLTSGAGPFMLIAPDIQDCVLGFSNISDWTVSYWQNMLENTGLAGENYLYFVSVDKDFPVLDRIKQEKLVYDKFEPWLVPVMAGSVLALILALAGVVLMTIGAGRNNEDKKVHLNFFDRCYTEIVAVVVFMIWLMGTSVIVQAMDDEEMRIVWKTIGFGSCSSVIRAHAFSIERFSRAIRTSRTSFRSFSVILATCAPLRGIITTRPSSSSFRIASLTGVLLTPRRSASAISISRSPGFSSPFKIALRSVLNTTSRNGRYSFMSTEKSFIISTSPFLLFIVYLCCKYSFRQMTVAKRFRSFPKFTAVIKYSKDGRSASAHHCLKRTIRFHKIFNLLNNRILTDDSRFKNILHFRSKTVKILILNVTDHSINIRVRLNLIQMKILIGKFCGNIDSRFTNQHIAFRQSRKSGQLLSNSFCKCSSTHNTIRNIRTNLYCPLHQFLFT